jgi:hypothetical protein
MQFSPGDREYDTPAVILKKEGVVTRSKLQLLE